jgi:WD40 repeat protein
MAAIFTKKIAVFSGKELADCVMVEDAPGRFGCLALSPCNRFIATGGADAAGLHKKIDIDNLILWDAKTLRPVWSTMGHPMTAYRVNGQSKVYPGPASIDSVAFSPDSKLLASAATHRSIRVWNVTDGSLEREFGGPGNGYFHGVSLAFSPDGSVLASATRVTDHTIRLWNPKTGELVSSLVGHNDSVHCLAYSPDGRTLASGGGDGIRLWNVATREPIAKLDDADTGIISLAFSCDGKTLFAGDSVGKLHYWRTAGQD